MPQNQKTTITQEDVIVFLKNYKSFFTQQFGIIEMSLFGTFARNEQTLDSDIDILIKFKEEQETFDNFMDVKFFLENHFHRKIDLVTDTALKPILQSRIEKDLVHI